MCKVLSCSFGRNVCPNLFLTDLDMVEFGEPLAKAYLFQFYYQTMLNRYKRL
jgi:hypothetical protein